MWNLFSLDTDLFANPVQVQCKWLFYFDETSWENDFKGLGGGKVHINTVGECVLLPSVFDEKMVSHLTRVPSPFYFHFFSIINIHPFFEAFYLC